MRASVLALAVLLLAPHAGAFDVRLLTFQADEFVGGFTFPVSFAFAPDGRMFVTEKSGTIAAVTGGVSSMWAQLPVTDTGEQGLLGLALHPEFAANGWLYVYHTDPGNGTNRVVRLTDSGGQGMGLTVVLDGIPRAAVHNGGVLAFGRDGTLFASTGDATVPDDAQDPASLAGKVLRVDEDGTPPATNPFPGSPVYSYGHRNVFGLAVDPGTGTLWETENGPGADDEVNRIVAGGNYGWPTVTGDADRPEFVDPAYVFPTNLPALTQATFHAGALFFGGWNSGAVFRAILTDDRRGIASVQAVHTFPGRGVTDVEGGPDGRVYASAVGFGGGGAIFVLTALPPVGGSGDHLLAYAAAAVVVASLFGLYLWKRRGIRGRERS